MRNCIIIANKGAGSFSQHRFDSICSQISSGGVAVEQIFCHDFDEMTETAATVSSAPQSPLIIAAGGDGTINAVLNGLAGNNATCAILPLGTANVMAIELGVRSASEAVARIITGQPRPFTAGLLKNGVRTSRFFLMAGVGFDGHIVSGVSLKEKRFFGKGAYLLSALRSLVSWDHGELQITTETEEFSCHSLIVCNAARYGGAFNLAPAANIFSADFEIIALKGNSRSASLKAIAAAALREVGSERLYRTTAASISINGAKPVQADGDAWSDSPVVILAEPDYAKIIL